MSIVTFTETEVNSCYKPSERETKIFLGLIIIR